MRKFLFPFLCFLTLSLSAQEIKLISLNDLMMVIDSPSAHLKVINFWASWCGPCIKELPYFDQLDKSKVDVYLISLDFPNDLEKAQKMIGKFGITSDTYLLNEKDIDKYMRAINEEWSGAIPATLFVDNGGDQHFYEHAFDQSELNKTVNTFIR